MTPEEDRYMKSIAENDQAWKEFAKYPTKDMWDCYTQAATTERDAAAAWIFNDPAALPVVNELSPWLFANGEAFALSPLDNGGRLV